MHAWKLTFVLGIWFSSVANWATAFTPPWDYSASPVIEEFDIARDGDFILLPVTIKGKTHSFILDTGSETTAFDTRLRPHLISLTKTSTLRASNGTVQAEMVEPPDAVLGKLKLRTDKSVICTDFSKVSHVIGKEIYGVLGMDFLQHHKFRIDFDHGKLVFLKSIDTTDANLGEPISIGYKDIRTSYVAAAASLDHIDDFLVDTGASTTGTLLPTFFDDLANQGTLKTLNKSKVQTVAGITTRKIGRIQFLAVKGSIVHNPVVKMSDSNLLGLGFWSRYVATFDFPNNVIYLREGAQFNEPDRYNLSGLHLFRIDGEICVHSVDAGSPADAAGIIAKDVIIKINNQSAAQQSMFTIRRLLSVEDSEVEMKIKRNNERFDVVVVSLDAKTMRSENHRPCR